MFNLANVCNLYGYDEVFKDIEINEKLDKDTLINTILDNCAMYEPIYPELEILNMKIKVFFKKHKIEFDKLVYLYNIQYESDYNPIWNKDGTKTHTETSKRIKDNTVNNTNTITNSNTITSNDEDTNKVSAYDSDAFSNDSQTSSTSNKQEKETSDTIENTIGNENENIELKIEDIEQGNIGVTTTATMIDEEVELQKKFNVYEVIARMFFDELCLHVAYTNQLPY